MQIVWYVPEVLDHTKIYGLESIIMIIGNYLHRVSNEHLNQILEPANLIFFTGEEGGVVIWRNISFKHQFTELANSREFAMFQLSLTSWYGNSDHFAHIQWEHIKADMNSRIRPFPSHLRLSPFKLKISFVPLTATHTPYKAEITIHVYRFQVFHSPKHVTLDGKIFRSAFWKKNMTITAQVRNTPPPKKKDEPKHIEIKAHRLQTSSIIVERAPVSYCYTSKIGFQNACLT